MINVRKKMYIEKKESLKKPIWKIKEGIDEFAKATIERIKNDEYKKEHILELKSLVKKMYAIKFDLCMLESDL